MIRYFGVVVTPESFAGAGWRSYAIRLLSWLVVRLSCWMTQLMYEVELSAINLPKKEVKEAVREAAKTGFEKRRPEDTIAPEMFNLPIGPRGARTSYREGRRNHDENPLRGRPLAESPLLQGMNGTPRSRSYARGRKNYLLMTNHREEPNDEQ